MKLKHLLTFITFVSCTLLGFTACDGDDYAPIILKGATESSSVIENNLLKIDAFNEGESYYIFGGNGHYTIENKSTDIVDYRYDGKILTFIPIGIGEASVSIGDTAGNRIILTIQVSNPVSTYKVVAVSASAIGKHMTQGETAILEKQIINESIVKEGGSFIFTYTDPSQTMGSVSIYPVASGRPTSGIFRQEQKVNETNVPYTEFTVTLANNAVHKYMLFNQSNENGLVIQEEVTDRYFGIYPQLEKAMLTYKVSL